MPARSVRFGERTIEVVDLTSPAAVDMAVFPGDPALEREIISRMEETGFEHYLHRLGDHVFAPHADAPKHQNPELAHLGVECWGPEHEFNEATLIDLEGAAGTVEIDGVRLVPEIRPAHLEPHEPELRAVTAVVVRTGAEAWRLAGKPFRPEAVPAFSAEAGAYLASFANLRVIGTDSLTVDVVNLEAPVHVVHQAWKHKLIVESLVHLSEIPAPHRRRFLLQTALVKITGATGCPVVARAYLT